MTPVTTRERPATGIPVGAIALGVVVAWYLYCNLVLYFAFQHFSGPLNRLDPIVVQAVYTFATHGPYAATLAVIGLDARRRVLAAGLAVVAWGLGGLRWLFVRHTVWREDGPRWDWLLTAADYLGVLVVVAAWGVARRRGRLWPLGLVAGLVVFWAYDEARGRALTELARRGVDYSMAIAMGTSVAFVAVLLVMGLICRQLELEERGRA